MRLVSKVGSARFAMIVLCDCFGDCDGFVLHERRGWKKNFRLKEVKLRELVLKGCCEKQEITVIVDRRNVGKVIGIRISYRCRFFSSVFFSVVASDLAGLEVRV